MKVLLALGGSGMVVGGLYASDALTAGQVYDIPLQQAYSELWSMPVPSQLQATTGTYSTSVAVRQTGDAIHWHFQLGGKDVAVFTAHLSAEDPGRTRVRIEYAAGEAVAPELQHLTSTALIRDLARLAMTEQVAAQLERRPVDQHKIADALARHLAAHPEQVREYGVAAGQMMVGMRQQIEENSRGLDTDGALADAPPIPPGRDQAAMAAATRPTMHLPTNE